MKPQSWRDMIRPAWSYYNTEGNGAGGSLHIVLDDGNLEDDSVRFCLRWAEGHQSKWSAGGWVEVFVERDEAGVALAKLLLSASLTQREKLYRNYGLYAAGAAEPGGAT